MARIDDAHSKDLISAFFFSAVYFAAPACRISALDFASVAAKGDAKMIGLADSMGRAADRPSGCHNRMVTSLPLIGRGLWPQGVGDT
jgi:hypothetical protein